MKIYLLTVLCFYLQFQTITSVCRDLTSKQNCIYYRRWGYCRSPYYRRYCQQTCGACFPTAPVCRDTNKHCGYWARIGHCRSYYYQRFMKSNCRWSCGLCHVVKPKTRPPPPRPQTTMTPTQTTTLKSDTTEPFSSSTLPITEPFSSSTLPTTEPFSSSTLPTTEPFSSSTMSTTKPFSSSTPTSESTLTTTELLTPPMPEPTNTSKPGQCGKKMELDIGIIVGGNKAPPHSWNWQVAIFFNERFICGGSLITPEYVVTAAHCLATFDSSDSKNINVIAGDHNLNIPEDTEQKRLVKSFETHEYYNGLTFINDIAIMKMNEPFTLNDNVNVVCLPEKDEAPRVGLECYITGWGDISTDRDSTFILQQAKMPVVNNSVCGERNTDSRGVSRITEDMICGGYEKDSDVSGCHGDSGGPFVCKKEGSWNLHGAVSWGSRRCKANDRYTVFTRISKYIDWIHKAMENLQD